jgi:two-component system nitrate/nitrite response regulator NarL
VKDLEDALRVDSVRHARGGGAVLAAATPAHADALRLRRENVGRTTHRPLRRIALSPRERQILLRVARGGSDKDIGQDLGVAGSPAKIHAQQMLRTLKLTGLIQAAVQAAEHGPIPQMD